MTSQPEKGTQAQGVSIIIKALNEEEHIEGAIRSALDEVRQIGGEVILADSGSVDRTVEIAQQFPITIVQLANIREASCGIGPQLGFQEVRCDYLFLMDGDMELVTGFISVALAELAKDPQVAGISGMLEESGELNAEFRLREVMVAPDRKPGVVSHLSGGGLYRVSAVRTAGYFSNRNLHSFEELELGIRLSHAGWKLLRLPAVSTRHHPHQLGSYAMLMSRCRNCRIFGPGEFLRSAFDKPYFSSVLPRFMFLYVTASWALLLLLILILPLENVLKASVFIAIFILPFLMESVRRKGVAPGTYSFVSWIISLYGALRGFCRTPIDPAAPIEGIVYRHGQLFSAEISK